MPSTKIPSGSNTAGVIPHRDGGSHIWTLAKALVLMLRPHQWIKNLLLFSGVIFAHLLLDAASLLKAVEAFLVFCATSSSLYIFNDLRDREDDRLHPKKRFRPITAGVITPVFALSIAGVLLGFAIVGAVELGRSFSIVASIYVLIAVSYTVGLKRIVILDVLILAAGFVIRAVAGAVAVGVPASPWLVLCTMMLALLLGIGKRRHELILLGDQASHHRASLEEYSKEFLDKMMGVAAGCAIVTYSLYCMAEETVTRVGSHAMVITVGFVVYGVFRYLYLAYRKNEGGDPATLFIEDRPIQLNVVLWLVSVLLILYW